MYDKDWLSRQMVVKCVGRGLNMGSKKVSSPVIRTNKEIRIIA